MLSLHGHGDVGCPTRHRHEAVCHLSPAQYASITPAKNSKRPEVVLVQHQYTSIKLPAHRTQFSGLGVLKNTCPRVLDFPFLTCVLPPSLHTILH